MSRADQRRRGYTLVEVIVATLLYGFLLSAMFELALSSKQSSGKADRKLMASTVVKTLQNQLKPFVTADAGSTTAGACGPNLSQSCGPNCCTQAMWCLNIPGVQTDSYGGGVNPCRSPGTAVPACYALGPGNHFLTCIAGGPPNDTQCAMPSSMRRPPFNGSVSYTVSNTCPPQVSVNVNWTEP